MSICIPTLIFDDENLELEQKCFLGLLYRDNEISGSNKEIAEKLHIQAYKIPNIISFLSKKDYIEIFFDKNNIRKIRITELKMLLIMHQQTKMHIPEGQYAMH